MTTETMTAVLTPRRVLWLALVTVLAASAVHVAGTFSTLEPGGALPVLARLGPYTGVLAAIAVDLGLLGLSWGVGARKRDKPGETPYDLWGGIAIFAVLSALANFDHALSVLGAASGTSGAAAWVGLDWYTRVKVVALSATLPLLAIYLTRVVETAVDARQDTATQDVAVTAPVAPAEAPSPEPAPVSGPLRLSLNGHDLTSPQGMWTTVVKTPPADVPPVLPQDKPARQRPATGQAKLTPELYRSIAAEHVPNGAGAQEADRIVARLAGTSTKTAQRARLAMS